MNNDAYLEIDAARRQESGAGFARWVERLLQSLILTLWMLSPVPREIAQPALQMLSGFLTLWGVKHPFTH